jgi:hypothetical protein
MTKVPFPRGGACSFHPINSVAIILISWSGALLLILSPYGGGYCVGWIKAKPQTRKKDYGGQDKKGQFAKHPSTSGWGHGPVVWAISFTQVHLDPPIDLLVDS